MLFKKTKKAQMDNLVKIISWIVFLGIMITALYFLFKAVGVN